MEIAAVLYAFFALVMLFLATVLLYNCLQLGGKLKRFLSPVSFFTMAIGYLYMSMGLAFEADRMYSIGSIIVGLGTCLVVFVPCGLAFFNRFEIRPWRNVFFLSIGLGFILMGIAQF